MVKNLPANAGDIRDAGLIPGLGRYPGEGDGNPFQYSCLENPIDRGAWRATLHRVSKNWTQVKCLSPQEPLRKTFDCNSSPFFKFHISLGPSIFKPAGLCLPGLALVKRELWLPSIRTVSHLTPFLEFQPALEPTEVRQIYFL